MTRRFVGLLLLTVLVLGQALPVSAQGMGCRMARHAPSNDCVKCDVNAAGSASVPTISSGSCCRFEAPREITPPPGVLAQSPRATSNDEIASVLCANATTIAGPDNRTVAPHRYLAIRSTKLPNTSTTRLQL